MSKKACNLDVRKTMCATCPFRPGSKYAYLAPDLAESAKTNTRICHQTGTNAIGGRTGKTSLVCRGARDLQLKTMAAFGVIEAATDEAWNKQRVAIGMKPQKIV